MNKNKLMLLGLGLLILGSAALVIAIMVQALTGS